MAGGFTGNVVLINAAAAASTALSIVSNVCSLRQNVVGAGSFGAGTVTFANFGAAHGSVLVDANTFDCGSSAILSSGACHVLLNSAAATLGGPFVVTGNTTTLSRTATSGAVGFLTQTSTTPQDPSDNISGNMVRFLNLAGTTSVEAINRLGGSSTAMRSIMSNSIWVTGTNSGTANGIVSGACAAATIQANAVTLQTASTSSTAIVANFATAAATVVANEISVTTATSSTSVATGISLAGPGAHSLKANAFTGTQTGSGAANGVHLLGAAGTAMGTGTGVSLSNGNNAVVRDLHVTNIIAGQDGQGGVVMARGLAVSGGTNTLVTACQVDTIVAWTSGAGTQSTGLLCSGGLSAQFDNTRCGAIRAPRAGGNAVRGVAVVSAVPNSVYKLFYCSIYLDAVSTGTDFGSCGLFHEAQSSSTTGNLECSNTLIANVSVPTGTGRTVASQRSSGGAGALANSHPDSNNNCLYAGPPDAQHCIYADGVSTAVTLQDYQQGVFPAGTVAPREGASVSGAPPFLSTDPAVPLRYLCIDRQKGGLLNGAAKPLASVQVDQHYQPRDFTLPDIGSDEFDLETLLSPGLKFSPLDDTLFTGPRKLTVFTTGTEATLYWRSQAGPFTAVQGVKVGSHEFEFTFGDGAPIGSTVEYYIEVEDETSENESNIESYRILPLVSGTVVVGTEGTFPSLTNSGGIFQALAGRTLGGNLRIEIASNLTAETGTFSLPAMSQAAPGGYSVKLVPTGAPWIISGSADGPLVQVAGNQQTIIDGSLTEATAPPVVGGVPSLRQLIIQNYSPSPLASVLAIVSTASGNVVRNLDLRGFSPASTSACLLLGATAVGQGGPQPNVLVENNGFTLARYGVHLQGTSAAQLNPGAVVTKNKASNLGRIGIYVGYQTFIEITSNLIEDVASATAEDAVAISLGHDAFALRNVATRASAHAKLERNLMRGVRNTNPSGGSAAGMTVAGSLAGSIIVVNNVAYDINSAALNQAYTVGFWVSSTIPQSVVELYYNTARLEGSRLFPAVDPTQTPSYAVAIDGETGLVRAYNNLLSNALEAVNGSPQAKSYAFGMSNSTYGGVDLNHNLYHTAGPLSAGIRSGSLAPNAGFSYGPLVDWQAASGEDANSRAGDPLFFGPEIDPFAIAPGSPAANAGVEVFGIEFDFFSNRRSGISPEIGAYELPPSKNLTGLTASDGTLVPPFHFATLDYTDVVVNTVETVTMTATLQDTNAVLRYRTNNGPYTVAASGAPIPVALNQGINLVDFEVTTEFGATQTYSVDCTRLAALTGGTVNKTCRQGYSSEVLESELVAACTFTTGFAPQVMSVTPLSQQGFPVVLQAGGKVVYGPAIPTFTGSDQFTCQMGDGYGQTTTCTVNMTVQAPAYPPQVTTLTASIFEPFRAIYRGGVPGLRYVIEFSEDLTGFFAPVLNGDLEPLIVTADGNGGFEVELSDLTPGLRGFYRARALLD